jgi:hypothetical protein
MSDLAAICEEFGIEIVPPRQQRQRGPGQTCAEGTLAEILRDEGSAHLRSVLMTIMESENNRMALVRPVLLAVSDILRAHPTWIGEKWFAQFDQMKLSELYVEAKKHREAMATRYVVAGMILERLRPHFDQPEQQRLI